jgi:hypothetical protein
MTCSKWWYRSAAIRNVSASPRKSCVEDRASLPRTESDGCLVASTGMPSLARRAVTSAVTVVLPTPTGPSSATRMPRRVNDAPLALSLMIGA